MVDWFVVELVDWDRRGVDGFLAEATNVRAQARRIVGKAALRAAMLVEVNDAVKDGMIVRCTVNGTVRGAEDFGTLEGKRGLRRRWESRGFLKMTSFFARSEVGRMMESMDRWKVREVRLDVGRRFWLKPKTYRAEGRVILLSPPFGQAY